jgi:hypothetical protein
MPQHHNATTLRHRTTTTLIHHDSTTPQHHNITTRTLHGARAEDTTAIGLSTVRLWVSHIKRGKPTGA